MRNTTLSAPFALKGFLFVFNSKEYKKSENVVVCISNSKRLTARFAKDCAKIAKENFNKKILIPKVLT
jgi:hypothetical protein